MLKIRQAQLDILEQNSLQQHVRRLSLALQEKYPWVFQYYSKEQMDRWVARQIEYLRKNNIDTQYAIEGILELFALLGESFERCEDPSWGITLIEKKGYSADKKYDLLMSKAKKVFHEMK